MFSIVPTLYSKSYHVSVWTSFALGLGFFNSDSNRVGSNPLQQAVCEQSHQLNGKLCYLRVHWSAHLTFLTLTIQDRDNILSIGFALTKIPRIHSVSSLRRGKMFT